MSTILDTFLKEVKNSNKNSLTQAEIFEMVARCQDNKIIIIDNMILDRDNYTIKVGLNKTIRLEKLTFELLVYMINREGRTINRQQILSDVWGADVVVTTRSIDVAIWKLRKAIGEDRIQTIKKIGYKFEIL